MKILIIGGNGTIGKRVSTHFKQNHEVIIGGRNSGDVTVDISDTQSIIKMFEAIPKMDAVISIAGSPKWGPFEALTDEDFHIGLNNKLMGQVNLVRIGQNLINSSGSFTLTTGILADDPVAQTTSAAMVNGAIHGFLKAVILEIKSGIRINVVSPGLVEDAAQKYEAFFPGHNPVPMHKVVNGYVKSVEGRGNGEIIRIYDNT